MALKQDERALLQLVCERGQSYTDLAELLAISEDEVREKARGALTELGGSDPDAEVGLTDYLLGQADPIGRADAVRYLQQDPAARELAETVITKLRVIAPGAELPSLPEAKGKRRKAAAPSRSEASAAAAAAPAAPSTAADEPVTAGTSSSPHQTRLIAGLAGGGLILLFAILAIAGVFSGEDSPAAGSEAALTDQPQTTSPVELTPESGSGVAGSAVFGFADSRLFVDLDLDGLDPDLSRKSAYVLWLMFNDTGGYPVSVLAPNQNGRVLDRLEVPAPIRDTVVGLARSVRISQSSVKRLRDDSIQAADTGVPLVPFSGEGLAIGRIPLVEGGRGTGGGAAGGGNGGAGGGQSGGAGTTTPGG